MEPEENTTIRCEPAGETAGADDSQNGTAEGDEPMGEEAEAGYGYGV